MNNILDWLGSNVLKILSNISDNVGINIIILTAVFSIIASMIVNKIKQIPSIPLGPCSMLFSLFINYLVERLPMIHSRMHLALSTVSSIIQLSEDYTNSFEAASGISAENSSSIASFLYYLPQKTRESWECNPDDLYSHLFKTMDQIRDMWIFPDVHQPVIHTWALIISIFFILCLVLAATEKKNGRYSKERIFFLVFQVLLTIYASMESMGMLTSIILLWGMEAVLYHSKDVQKKRSKCIMGK